MSRTYRRKNAKNAARMFSKQIMHNHLMYDTMNGTNYHGEYIDRMDWYYHTDACRYGSKCYVTLKRALKWQTRKMRRSETRTYLHNIIRNGADDFPNMEKKYKGLVWNWS